MRALMVSAASRSSGKTTLAMALAALLARRGLAVRAFKKGPDFIDPQWLTAASGAPCRNLDVRLQGRDGVLAYWKRHGCGDVAIVEGNQGLHDGVDGDSNAALARLLGIPVVVVMDARGMGRTAAALALGLKLFDRDTNVAGVVLNRVAGARHEATLRAAIEGESGIRVLGAIPESAATGLVQRHLGLMPPNEALEAAATIARLAQDIGPAIDLDGILAVAAECPAGAAAAQAAQSPGTVAGVRIGIARDRAFGFYYPDDLEALRAAGAALVAFDTLRDAHLPGVDGVFLGGGFPETCASALEANASLRGELRRAIDAGLPVYAECGGLMYLSRSLTHDGATHRMVGAIAADAVMHGKPVGKGYVTLEPTASHPWGGARAQAHEFHYSSLENVDPRTAYAYRVERGHGIDGRHDGIVHRNTLACYAHLRSVGGNDWAARFVGHVRRVMRSRARQAA